MKSEVLIGQAGEHLAACVLFEMGVKAAIAPTAGMDLIAFDDERVYRIEVKSTRQYYPRHKKLYCWNTSRGSLKKKIISPKSCDIIALVALDIRKVFFKNISEITGKSTRLSANRFVDNCEQISWEDATAWN